jgi:phage gpG-like protein
MIKVTIPNLPKLTKALNKYPETAGKELSIAFTKSALQVVRETKPITPLKTGRLRSSIGQQGGEGIFLIEKMRAIIGTNVKYAVYVHEGTKFMAGRPFLATGTQKAMSDIQQYFKNALTNITEKIAKQTNQ